MSAHWTYRDQDKWDRRFMRLAKEVSAWSKDPSSKIGAVLTDKFAHVVATGFNGFPPGVDDSPERYANRELKYKIIIHAEINAIMQAGTRARDCNLYVYPSFGLPNICTDCATKAIQAGIKRVIGYTSKHPREDWAASLALAGQLLTEAGIAFYQFEEEE